MAYFTKKQSAFTLIDLLAVIISVMMLIAIIIPSMCRSRAISKCNICQAQLGEIGKAIRAYREDYKSLPWARETSGGDSPIFSYSYGMMDLNQLFKQSVDEKGVYLKDTPISKALEEYISKEKFKCPSDDGPKDFNKFNGQTFFDHEDTSYDYCPLWLLEYAQPYEYKMYASTNIMSDFSDFHSQPGKTDGMAKSDSSYNYLYLDGRVENKRHNRGVGS